MDTIQKTLKQMDSSIKNLETDLKNAKSGLSDEDKFLEVMGVSFYKTKKFLRECLELFLLFHLYFP